MITMIVSGGQTGADCGGLMAGRDLGLITGGLAPKDWLTETGPDPSLKNFGLEESDTYDYKVRTETNVLMGDATVIFGRRSPGSNATEEFCHIHAKPCLWVWTRPENRPVSTKVRIMDSAQFHTWLRKHKPGVLNVTGNRESVNPGIQKFVHKFLVRELEVLKWKTD